VLGFLSVSTDGAATVTQQYSKFQSRAGFSECLDEPNILGAADVEAFQSRAGFSECLDSTGSPKVSGRMCFNPVLGFLSVSTVVV